jgi:hypothetical protein
MSAGFQKRKKMRAFWAAHQHGEEMIFAIEGYSHLEQRIEVEVCDVVALDAVAHMFAEIGECVLAQRQLLASATQSRDDMVDLAIPA